MIEEVADAEDVIVIGDGEEELLLFPATPPRMSCESSNMSPMDVEPKADSDHPNEKSIASMSA